MKKQDTIRELLGFTQLEMASVLSVSRTRYSMFELGHRALPLAATILLAEMLQHIQTSKNSLENSNAMVLQYAAKQLQLNRMLKENEYQLLLTSRKTWAVEKTFANKLKVLQLVEFLSLRNETNEIAEHAALRTISNNANKSLKEQGLASLSKLKLKLELLQLEKLLLDAELRKLSLPTDFISNDE